MTKVFHAWQYGRSIEIQSNLRRKKLHRTNQGSNFLGNSFSNKDNVRASMQFSKESQTQHLKRWFFLKNRPICFHINSTSVLDWSNETSWVFPALKSTSHFLVHSTVSCRSDSSSKANLVVATDEMPFFYLLCLFHFYKNTKIQNTFMKLKEEKNIYKITNFLKRI